MSQRHTVKVGHGTLTIQAVGNTPFRAVLVAPGPGSEPQGELPGTQAKACGSAVESCETASRLVGGREN